LLKLVFNAALLLFASTAMASAAELDGVVMPDTHDVAGYHLTLNGLALRTYSVLRVHVYVAGLYLERRSSDGDAILNSSQPKLLRFVFLRDVDAEDARKSWREGFDRNCPAPCGLPAVSIDRFLAAVPSVHNGDTSALLFTARKVDFLLNGRLLGRVADPDFVRVILATFIGRSPNSAEVKEGLLGAPG
jgi:Chalcone isomerase-like